MLKNMPAWTYSSLEQYSTCPKKYYHLKVVRDVVDPPTVHTEWGQRVHEALELRIKDGSALPEGMRQWESLVGKISSLPGEKLTEMKMAVDSAYQVADWNRSWSRGIADLVVVNGYKAATLDYKTGKRKPSDQLELYAAYVFSHFPKVTECATAYVWLKDRSFTKAVVKKDELPAIKKKFAVQVARLESSFERDSWPAKPSGLCREYCPVSSCEFFGKKNR